MNAQMIKYPTRHTAYCTVLKAQKKVGTPQEHMFCTKNRSENSPYLGLLKNALSFSQWLWLNACKR